MTTYTLEEKTHARQVLGLKDQSGLVIPDKEKTKEALLVRIELMKASLEDRTKGRTAEREAAQRRLKIAIKAKNKANQRADLAEAAIRAMLDNFSKLESK